MRRQTGWAVALAGAACLHTAGCDGPPSEGTESPPPTGEHPAAQPPPTTAQPLREAPKAAPPEARKVAPARAGQEIEVPAGDVVLGTLPGTAGRNPSAEADAVRVHVPAFSIDRLPYPNDPEQAPTSSVNRAQASALCKAQGKRLCSEVEWERACQGEARQPYPTVDQRWPDADAEVDPCGADGLACSSGFDVLRMGTEGREWTSSKAGLGLGDRLRTAVVRGASPDAPASAHRCFARDAATPDSRSSTLLVRCCRGEAEAPTYPATEARPNFALTPMSDAQAQALLASLPQTADLAQGFELFDGDDYEVALRKGGRSKESLLPWVPVEHPLTWSPVHGEQVLVLAGRVGQTAAVLFIYVTEQGENLFGGSFELEDEPDPIAVAFRPDRPEELLWSSCWGCGAEGGAISLRDDGRVVIVQR